MERTENDKEGLGTVYYALSLLIVTFVTFKIKNNTMLGIAPIFIMSYGDGFAAVVGKLIKSPKYKIYDTEKSIAGSLAMFIITFLIMSIYLGLNTNLWVMKSLISSLVLTLTEAVSIRGTDNITVPIAALLMLMIM